MTHNIPWPDGKRFAFTIFDDADCDQMANTRPVYDFLADLGIFTTKSAWMLQPTETGPLDGLHCEDPAYLEWILQLQARGFEIGWHNARCHSSERALTEKALDDFERHFGHRPYTMSNHFQNKEAIYWGADRLHGLPRLAYNLTKLVNKEAMTFEGHVEDSPYFWGDLCRRDIRYVRNFVFREIDTLSTCPFMPYFDPTLPYANGWYASAEAGHLGSYNDMLCEENQDRLLASGGACILYAHFGKDFYANGALNPTFKRLMERLAGLGGWYVPLQQLLDFLKERQGGIHTLTASERRRLEHRWLKAKLKHGSS